ncbi:protoporphyrinogen oxidase HemJ [Helicobacter cappadocius]|uniref:Protoporphyrinogen IX oxidase n=1 Tax=Helicobacter cappadocius TaxID=3063998 RepID=A0AA90PRL1_9HELI|nr:MULTISPECIES: protoporphyrinogen oxidase HemJ [unclassified Helicobacter]MDO7253092.1 protoporphyrinogen oxidase HemJ [Helicobacter sp. faydin-H75]MDP2538782.1 protoporphyrinogen oxidase HemJ [Helicobacter sp. faydin-H76]
MEILNQYYLWIKAVHIIAFVSWMAMLFYLPRIFVYHVENQSNQSYTNVAKVQERKLYSFIGKPAMLLTLITGILMISINPELFRSGSWLHIKLLFVVFLLIYHFMCGYYVRAFQNDRCEKSGKFFRVFNEIPTLCLVVIVVCAVIKF